MARWRMPIGVAVVVAASAAMIWRLSGDPIRRLVAASSGQRAIETRLSGGFEWAPLRRQVLRSARTDAVQTDSARGTWKLAALIGDDSSANARRASAMAMLLTGRPEAAVARFERLAADTPTDAKVLSDLAAARYEAGVAESDAALLAEALAAADAALRLDPSLTEALFNRAVVVERLGIRDEARKAWTSFLAVEGTSKWAGEARERISHLGPIAFFREELAKHYERLANDAEAAHEMARERPEETRLYTETLILADWAAAAAAGDEQAAARHLRVAREFGVALARNHGEYMVQQAVRAIDDADPSRRRHLIRAHLLFHQGQDEFKTDHAALAQAAFESAANEFAQGGSPVNLLAEFFLAHTFHALGNLPEARRRELRLLAEAPPEFRAYRAQLLWHLGLTYQSDGDWGRALDAFTHSVVTFDDLGENDYAAAVRELMAEVYDRNGDPQSAWKQRVVSLQGIGRMTTSRLETALANIGRGAMARKEWPVTLSFLQIAGDTAEEIYRPTAETEMRLLQARAFVQTGNADAAHACIAKARTATTKIDDPAARRDALADIDGTEAILASPQLAISLLTRSIDYHSTRGRRILLPELLLLRGRAYRDLGQTVRATADFEAGIGEIEKHRESLPRGESRWGTLQPAEELFEEAVAAAMKRGDIAAAFDCAERSRARELLDALGVAAPTAMPVSFAADTAVIEYFSLPDRLVIFAVSRGGIYAVEEHIERTALEKEAETFQSALAAGSASHRTLGESLYRHLVAPIESNVSASETLVFVPGPRFPSIAFAALPTGSGYLVERHAIVVSPSAAAFSQLTSRKGALAARRTVLVVANPTTTTEPGVLSGAEMEANDVAQFYSRSTRLVRDDATIASFRRYAPAADVIHMATHGATDAAWRGGGALLLSDGRLDSQMIASITLPHTYAVVLASCDSALGPKWAEGMISAARGFLAAGVPSVVATLWQIDDAASAQFFPRIHRDLARGVAAATAVRQAQIESIRRGESPALWAAVQCIGS
jgi:CHAT domain-containing protein